MGVGTPLSKTLTAYHTVFSIENRYIRLKQVSTTLTKRLSTLIMRQGARDEGGYPPPKNAHRLPDSNFEWKSIFLPVRQVSTTLTKRVPTLTMRQWPRRGGGYPPPKNAYRLPYSSFDWKSIYTSKTEKHDAYQGKQNARHEALSP